MDSTVDIDENKLKFNYLNDNKLKNKMDSHETGEKIENDLDEEKLKKTISRDLETLLSDNNDQEILVDKARFFSYQDDCFHQCKIKLTRDYLIITLLRQPIETNVNNENFAIVPIDHITGAYHRNVLYSGIQPSRNLRKNEMINQEADKLPENSDCKNVNSLQQSQQDDSTGEIDQLEIMLEKSPAYLFVSAYTPNWRIFSSKSLSGKTRRSKNKRLNTNNGTNKDGQKKRNILIFSIDQLDTGESNACRVDTWVLALTCLIRGHPFWADHRVVTPPSFQPLKAIPMTRKVLVMLNPFSGRGKALEIFEQKVEPFLSDSDTEYELFTSDRPNGARDFVANNKLDLSQWDGIVVVSGDGLFHEILNGIMARQDWPLAINIPLGIVPAGSGNGLAHSLIKHDYPEALNRDIVTLSVMNITRGQTKCSDLVKITLMDTDRPIWSFLSFGWGLMADIDIESECLRMIGEARFTIWSLYRAFSLRKYRGKLSYRVAKDQKSDSSFVHVERDDFICVYAAYQTHLSSDVRFAPDAKLSDGLIWLVYLTGQLSVAQIVQFLLSIKKGNQANLPFVTMVAVTWFKLEPLVSNSRIVVDGELIDWRQGPITAEVVPQALNLMTRRSSSSLC